MRSFFTSLGSLLSKALIVLVLLSITPAIMCLEGCRMITHRPPPGSEMRVVKMEVTGYDNGPKSCGWTRDWLGRPVYASGKLKGKRKIVGQTSSGKMAKRGTIAADTTYYPYGTVMFIPGYGYGVVEDKGGAIKGKNRIDLWFPSEKQAMQWGRKKNVTVHVWIPKGKKYSK